MGEIPRYQLCRRRQSRRVPVCRLIAQTRYTRPFRSNSWRCTRVLQMAGKQQCRFCHRHHSPRGRSRPMRIRIRGHVVSCPNCKAGTMHHPTGERSQYRSCRHRQNHRSSACLDSARTGSHRTSRRCCSDDTKSPLMGGILKSLPCHPRRNPRASAGPRQFQN